MSDDGFWTEPPDEAVPVPGAGDTSATDTAALPTQREHAPAESAVEHEAALEDEAEGTRATAHESASAAGPVAAAGTATASAVVPAPTVEPAGSGPGLRSDATPGSAPGAGAETEFRADTGADTRADTRADSGAGAHAHADTYADVGAHGDGEADALAADLLKPRLEAVLMVVENPVPDIVLAQVLEQPTEAVLGALRELSADYTAQGRGFDLRQVAGGWRFYTRPEHAEAVEKFILDGQRSKLTQAALETLAVVAYRQPVSRGRISAVRGVNCDGVMRTLLARGLVEEAGVEPDTGAYLYRTTDFFLERMGLVGLDELPELAPFLPEVEALEAETEGGFDGFPVTARPGPVAAERVETGDTGGADPAATVAEDGAETPERVGGAPADPVPAADDPTDTTGHESAPTAEAGVSDETGQTTTDD